MTSPPTRRHLAWIAALFLLVPAAASAQQAPTLHDRAIAAGYKALTLCSGIFDAEAVGTTRTQESIEANELKGIYPEYDGLIAAMPAVIDPTGNVQVTYDPKAPPRIAISQWGAGCLNLPIGTPKNVTDSADLYTSATDDTDDFWTEASRPIPLDRDLSPLVTRAFDGSYGAGSNTTALLVMADGHLSIEHYAPGFGPNTPTRTWSVAKSISGTLIGVAVAKGLLDPKAPVPIPEWQKRGDPRAAITLDNLMRMASGLHSDTAGNRTDNVYFGGTAVTEETVNWPLEVKPGTRFRYANNDILLAIHGLAGKESGDEMFPQTMLLGPIGMNHTIPERDWKGNFILSSQVWSTPRDLARLGLLWLNDGVWDGKRILPEGWMKYMTTPSGPQPASGPGYGATLWLFGPAQGLPAGSYAAQGNRGQFIMVIPSRHIVIVRRGEDPGAARFDIARFTADILEALK